ncbi:hypothetical protein KJK32_44770 [Streptomyces sp. JCM17656]|nr:hypothetical protein KJK32_44770 [Streptomyces sp. JCM17656]
MAAPGARAPLPQRPRKLAFFAVHSRAGIAAATLVQVGGMRWGVEDCFETAKNDCGLDHYEVRHWEPWHRHIALAMAAFAFLTVTATRTAATVIPDPDRPRETGDYAAPARTWPPLHLPLDTVLH